jgi:uncharacterized protein YhjY with autotransporter beta-barrel domain/phospholipase/lecithinase/hemolysin
MLAAVGSVPGAAADEKFQRLFVFGDSFADLTLSDKPASNPLAPPGLGLSLWRVYPVPLAANLGIKGAHIVDVAVGGATASPTAGNPSPLISPGIGPPANLPQQVDAFLNSNLSFLFGPRDLITINIGGNDGIGFTLGGGTIATAPFAAQLTAASAAAQIQRLANAGGQTFVLGGFSGLSGLPLIPDPLKGIGDAFGEAYFLEMQKQLLTMAQSGTRFFILDLHRLGQQVEANLARYGLVGVMCPGGGAICGGSINSTDQSKFFVGPDGLHLTNRGFEIVAAYMANIVMAPDTIAVQPDIVRATTSGFTSSLLDRLGGARQLASVAGITVSSDDDGMMGLGHRDKSRTPRTGPASRVTTFAAGTLFGGSRDETFSLAGYEYDATAGTAGIEYSLSRNLIVGLAGNYTTTHADLTSGANINLDAIQAAAYLSYATKQIFADVLVGLGSHDVSLARPGVIDAVRGETDAFTFALAARGGYLFDFGRLRAGPIAGLTYMHTRVDGYTEKGDPLLTFDVSSQTLDTLTGQVGLRFLAPFRNGDNVVIPYLNVLLEHQFGDDTRTLTASLSQAPLLPILSPVATFDARTYGKVEGGITFQLDPGLGATISGSTTFARDDAHDFRVTTGLNFKF